MSASTFVLQVARIDATNSVVTFKVFSTSDPRKLAVSRFFVLRTLALDGRADLAVCKALTTALASLSPTERDQRLVDLAFVDQFICKTRIASIENYIDWETMDQDYVLARLLPRMKLPSTYQLEVHFSDPAHLVGFTVGPRLSSTQADGWIPGIEALLRTDPENLYTFKNDDEHWRLHDYLAGHNTYGEFEIAWTNAQDSVMAKTNGVLPFKDARWGAIDRESGRASPSPTRTTTTTRAPSGSGTRSAGSPRPTCSANLIRAPLNLPRPISRPCSTRPRPCAPPSWKNTA